MPGEENPFARFVAPPAPSTPPAPEGPNPFAQFGGGLTADVTPAAKSAAKPMSRVVHVTDEGFPIFEDEADNRSARRAVAGMFKDIPLGVARSFVDVPEGILQLGARAAESAGPEGSAWRKYWQGEREGFEKFQKEGEEGYQASRSAPEAPDVGRIGGSIAAAAPLAAAMPGAYAARLIPRMASGLVSGAVTGATQPVEAPGGDFWAQKAMQTGVGGAGGAIAPVIQGALARVVAPKTNPDVTKLMNAGVTPTPGQIMGGSLNRLEEAAEAIPFVGDAIKAARQRSVEDLNRAAINRSLEPIGEKLGARSASGRESVAEMGDKISNAFGTLLPTLKWQLSPAMSPELNNAMQLRASLSDPAKQALDNILQHDVFGKIKNGGMNGETYKEVESELGRQATSYTNSAVASERGVGRVLSAVKDMFWNQLERSNPGRSAELAAVKQAYALAQRVEGAAASTGTEKGTFTPAQLVRSVKSLDPSLRDKRFARGEALMQDLAEAGKSVLGDKVPNSGTPFRSAAIALPTLAAMYSYNPALAAGTVAGGLGAAGAYTRPGTSLLANLLAQRSPIAQPAANLIRTPVAATLPAILAQGRLQAGGEQ